MKIRSVDDLTLADDFMFREVMSNKENAKMFLEHLFEKPIAVIRHSEVQEDVKNFYDARGLRFDVIFIGDGTVYNIEMQQVNKGDLGRRVRYHQAVIDGKYLKAGMTFSELPECRIIFICMFDIFGKGCARYVVRNVDCFTGDILDTGSQFVFLNADYKEPNASLGIIDLLDYLNGNAPGTHFVKSLDSSVERAKMNDKFRGDFMSFEEIIQDARKEGIEEGRQQGIEQGRQQGIEQARQSLEAEYVEALVRGLRITREDAIRLLKVDGGKGVQRMELK